MKKSLADTNPYLKDAAKRKKLLRYSMVSSFAVEGIYLKGDGESLVKESEPEITPPRQASSRSPR
ncbi:MAG: hypothetical protein JXK94_06355 [Deltaproteobacteria bacterium]|nr:hypothetical protein [Deltaproteobacteria bacterium]